MIRMNSNSRTITPDTVMSYDWFNALQDEVCTPIEKKLGLSSRLDQLTTSIQTMIEGTGVNLGEVADYSGNPVAIPGLSIKPGENISFYLCLDIGIRKPIDFQVDQLPDAFRSCFGPPNFIAHMGFYNALSKLDTSSSNFINIAPILSSEELLEKRSPSFGDPTPEDFSIKGYEPLRLPDVPNLSRSDAVSIVRKINAKKLMERQTSLITCSFALTQNGISSSREFSTFADYASIQALIPSAQSMLKEVPQENWESASVSWPFYFFLSTPMPPVILSASPEGQIYYFFNKMVYGDLISCKLGLFNQARVFCQ